MNFAYDGPTITLVANPSSGRGRGKKLLPHVISTIVHLMPQVHLRVHQSTSFDDARLRTIQAVEAARPPLNGLSPDALVVLGGDGMAHLGVNACAETDVALGVIPAGTGNDFCRGMGIPSDAMDAVKLIATRQPARVDLNEVRGRLVDGAERRWVGCTVATGFDARVSQASKNSPDWLGSLVYGYQALKQLAGFEPLNYHLTIDGVSSVQPAMLIAVSNSSTYGGGMQISPQADVTDGQLDITLIHPVSRLTLLTLLPLMYSGKFVKDPAVELLRGREVHIDGEGLIGDGDGELLGPPPLVVRSRKAVLNLYRRVGQS